MKQFAFLLLSTFCFAVQALLAQITMTGTKYDIGYTTIFQSRNNSAGKATMYYGLKEEKSGTILLPMEYANIYYTNVNKLFRIQNMQNKAGLYDAATQKQVAEPQFDGLESFSDGIARVNKDSSYNVKLYGAVDITGKTVIPLTYRALGRYSEGLMFFSKGGDIGYINIKNEVVIPPTYQYAGDFKDGLAHAKLKTDTGYGYINKKQEWIIPATFASANPFYNNYATVTKKGAVSGKLLYGVINKKGQVVVPLVYDFVSETRGNGTFVFTRSGKYGIIDSTGKVLSEKLSHKYPAFVGNLIVMTFDTASGILTTKGEWLFKPEYKSINTVSSGFLCLEKNNTYTVIDKNGKTILKPVTANKVALSKSRFVVIHDNKVEVYNYSGKLLQTISHPGIDEKYTTLYTSEDSIKVGYKQNIAIYDVTTGNGNRLDVNEAHSFSEDGVFAAKYNVLSYDYFDYTGKQKTNKKYNIITNFTEGYAVVLSNYGDTAVLIDKSFKEVKKSLLLNGFQGKFSEGMGKVQVNKNYNYAFIDTRGEEVFSIPAADVGDYSEGFTWIKKANSRFLFADKTGKSINQELYDDVKPFSNGVACVKKTGKWGVINKTGDYVIQPEFDDISSFLNDVAIAKKGVNYFLINKNGQRVHNDNYTQAGNPENSFVQVKKGDKMGIIDLKGNIIIPFEYKYVYIPSEGIAWAQKDSKVGAVDLKNKTVIPFEYDNGLAFKNGFAFVALNKKWGLINKAGKLVLPIAFESLGSVYKNQIIGTKKSGYVIYAIK